MEGMAKEERRVAAKVDCKRAKERAEDAKNARLVVFLGKFLGNIPSITNL
jgi:hypothetical protein